MKKPIPFVDFCERTLKLWLSPAWRVLLKVSVDGVEDLDDAERVIALELFGDPDEIPPEALRALVWRLGRGSGKTTIAAALALWIMLTANLDPIGPGMLAAAVTVSGGGKPGAKISVGVARELVRRVPSLERLVCDDGDTADGFSLMRLDYGRRVSFVAVAASRGGVTLRSYDILALIIDESEFLTSNAETASVDGYAISDRDLFNAARPRLHGPAIFISTPWPAENLTDELFTKNHGAPKTALAAIGASTFMRPDDKRLARDVAQALADDPGGDAAREFLCKTGSRGGSRWLDPDSIAAAVLEGRPLVVYAPEGAAVAVGGDLGLERDASGAAAVCNHNGDFTLLEFDEVQPTREHPLAPGYVVRQRFAPLMRRHGVRSITMDGWYRQSAIEHLEAEGLDFDRAPEGQAGKYDSYMFVRALFREGRFKIPAAPRLLAQLRAVTLTPQSGGGVKITSPRRMGQTGHCDIVSALVCAAYAAREDGSRTIWDAIEESRERGDLAHLGAAMFPARRGG